jgi:glycosyltransferase involved in cell wall biosynthesis
MARILYLTPIAEIGGAERSLLELLARLPRDRFEPLLAVPRPGPLGKAADALGVRVIDARWPRAALRVGRSAGALGALLLPAACVSLVPTVRRLAGTIRTERIDLVHTNGTKAHLVGAAAARLSGAPLVWHMRDVLEPGVLRQALRALAARIPRLTIANSDACAASIGGGREDSTLRRVYDGIDLAEFTPGPADPALRASLGIGAEDFVIATIGALAPLKGQVHLIRAMPRVLAKAPAARLLIVGSEMYDTLGHRGYEQSLREEAARIGVSERVVFSGWRDDVAALYRAVDLVALASVRPESFGRVLVEAMACERPVIATDLGGPREILDRPEVGTLVPPADPAALADAILALLADGALRDRMGRLGRARALDAFSIERNVAGICAAYDEILRS